jgi:hypothetical protein
MKMEIKLKMAGLLLCVALALAGTDRLVVPDFQAACLAIIAILHAPVHRETA